MEDGLELVVGCLFMIWYCSSRCFASFSRSLFKFGDSDKEDGDGIGEEEEEEEEEESGEEWGDDVGDKITSNSSFFLINGCITEDKDSDGGLMSILVTGIKNDEKIKKLKAK